MFFKRNEVGGWIFMKIFTPIITWKEHMSVSSTLIIPPALSNSPQ